MGHLLSTNLYNEIDPEAVAVLREMVASNVIAPGVVEPRSIKELTADDVRGFTQVHFFAGAGLWSVAARLAGWPDSKPLWTASCPCQPFSAAGKQGGADDPRHLWPDLYRIIRTARDAGQPVPIIVGEQVAGAAGYDWFDGVRTDLAREGIAARTIDIPACAVDAPHERNRQWWAAVPLADTAGAGRDAGAHTGTSSRRDQQERGSQGRAADGWPYASSGRDSGLVDAARIGRGEGRTEHELRGGRSAAAQPDVCERACDLEIADQYGLSPLGHAISARLEGQRGHVDHGTGWSQSDRPIAQANGGYRPLVRPNGSWFADWEWILCHDQKARRAKPSIPMLIDGMAGRIGLWRLAGNSIVPILAAEVLKAILETEEALRGQ